MNKEFFLKINDIKHWCKIKGIKNKSTPLVIIHGGPGGNNYAFERTIGPYLEQFATVIYYEQRGSGRSEAPVDEGAYSIPLLISDLKSLCTQLKLNNIIPLGFSFGGELAFEFALAYPNLVEKIIVQAPSDFCDNNRISYVQIYGFAQVASGDLKDKIEEIINSNKNIEEKNSLIWEIVDVKTVDKLLFKQSKNAELNRKYWEESGLINTGLMLKVLKSQKNEIPLLNRVSKIEVPTLILIGLYDRNVGLNLGRDFANNISHSKLVIFENSAHFPDIEESEKYADVIKDFII
ncbi:MAG: alpha/beta fold hydrolase [Candidatus Lokiarchaeia archaeon]